MTAEAEISMEETCSNTSIYIRRNLSAFVNVDVACVGKWYHLYQSGENHNISGGIQCDSDSEEEEEEEVKEEVVIEDDIHYLRSLDPARWKEQDHYNVLGLKAYRYKATDEDIKKAYRMKVLKHHPDKRKGAGEEIREDDDYFTCITKAYEILGSLFKRHSYDSVDPEFDDYVPSVSSNNKSNFFEVFGPAFELNARWSVKKHVPVLGKIDDSRQRVDKFYTFWYDFDSWREFSYLDEEEKEKGQDREERRWLDRQNKAERARRRKEEMARLRRLVDNAYSCDPRIAKFVLEEKERKLAQKKAKQDAILKKQEEEIRHKKAMEEEARKRKEAEETLLKKKHEAEKKEREAKKKAVKKEKLTLRNFCRDHNYFSTTESQKLSSMTNVELLCDKLDQCSLKELNVELNNSASNLSLCKDIFSKKVSSIRQQIDAEREAVTKSYVQKSNAEESSCKGTKMWTQEDITVLIKAVNLFPAGTTKRWEVVAEYINQHSSSNKNRVAKEVLAKAKELQHSDQHLKEAANKTAMQDLLHKKNNPANAIDDATASQRFETPQEMLGVNLSPWSNEEQRLLEQALKTYSSSTPDRWDCIAQCLPNRSKKDCMKRYKELAEMVKAKKAAQAAAAAKK